MKLCKKCNNYLLEESFHKDKKTKDGLYFCCKSCRKENYKKYWSRNKVKLNEQQRQHYQENRETILERNKNWKEGNPNYMMQYRMENKDKIREKENEYQKKKLKEDLSFKLAKTIRNRLRDSLKRKTRAGSMIKDLGCSVDFLKSYLESQFYSHPETGEQMSWDNHGKGYNTWQIDHIIELQDVDLTNREDFLKVCNYKNLQPLWYVDHKEKR